MGMMPHKTVAIIQPSFLPWRGYFSIIRRCDAFVFFDDVQYDRRGWRNRNQIKTPQGLQWITVPTKKKGKYEQLILETEIDYDSKWQKKVLGSIRAAYAKAPHFKKYFSWVSDRLEQKWETISDLDIQLTQDVCGFLDIQTTFFKSSQMKSPAGIGKIDRLISLCQELGAQHYLSGPSTRDYIQDTKDFEQAGLQIEFVQYDLPEYPQLSEPFEKYVSVIDVLMNCDEESIQYL